MSLTLTNTRSQNATRLVMAVIIGGTAAGCMDEEPFKHSPGFSPATSDCSAGITGPDVDCDGDTFTGDSDCNDFHAAVHPGADEVPCNGLDDDCNGLVDDVDPSGTWFVDSDSDGFGDPLNPQDVFDYECSDLEREGLVSNASDCDDTNSAVYPDAEEVCNDIDDDCDGWVDDDDPNLDLGTTNLWYTDEDGDGYIGTEHWSCDIPDDGIPGSTGLIIDCDDTESTIHPAGTEVCNDIDDDCDGVIDEELPQWYSFYDNDGDGEGDPTRFYSGCSTPSGYVNNPYDCDDSDPGANTSNPNDLFIDSNGDGDHNCWAVDIYEFDASSGIGSAYDWLWTDADNNLVGYSRLSLCGYTDAASGSTVGTPFGNANGNDEGEAVWNIGSSGAITERSNDACNGIGMHVGGMTSLSVEVDYTMNDTGGSGLWVGVEDNMGGHLVTTIRYPYIATPPLGLWWFDKAAKEVTPINEVNDANFGGASGTLSIYMADIIQTTVNGSSTIVDDDSFLTDTGLRMTPETVFIGSWENDLDLEIHSIRIYNPDGWIQNSLGYFE